MHGIDAALVWFRRDLRSCDHACATRARDEIPALAARLGVQAVYANHDHEPQAGYPLVDAAMRQLNQTGYMHNRLRMVTASFLVKDLQVDPSASSTRPGP